MKILLSITVFASVILFACNGNDENETSTATTLTTETPSTQTPSTNDNAPLTTHAEAKLSGTYADTTVDGKVEFHTDSAGKVIMTLNLTIAKKAGKTIAVHIHEHGNCGDTATLAHGHWNPTNAQHGKWGSSSFHSGDIGNIKLDAKGKGTLSITTDLWTLGGKSDKNILGKSVIVHGGMDDYKTQPTGNSGGRIGCGVIQ
jgi:superoxide dismutase, Cu-Zn family